MKRMLSLALALVLLLSLVPLASSIAAEYPFCATVKGGWLRLRAQASYSAETLASYYTGTVVTVNAAAGGWYYVTTPDYRNGYMRSEYLSNGTGSAVGTTMTVSSSNGKGVCLRTGPSTSYPVIAVYPVGTKAKVLYTADGWYQVKIGYNTGYMMSKFLISGSTSPSQPTGKYTAYVVSGNGLGVRLRSGAGMNYSVLGLYPVGTKVTVLKHNSTWDYISIGSRVGYMKNEFLTTRAPSYNYPTTPPYVTPTNPPVVLPPADPVVPKTLTGAVSLPVSATVGSYLIPTTHINVPDSATVNCCWMVGGSIVSYANSLLIQPGWENRTVYVRITVNGYDGVLMNVTPCLILGSDPAASPSDA